MMHTKAHRNKVTVSGIRLRVNCRPRPVTLATYKEEQEDHKIKASGIQSKFRAGLSNFVKFLL